ncbi:MAG: hypothetical protein ACXWQR_13070 [Ktedonobacterales bacterium]
MAAIAERARYLTRDKQATLAVRIGAVADDLRWGQCFLLPDRFLTDQGNFKASVDVIPPHA